MITPINKPAFYFPPEKGVFEIKPGLFALQTDFGNGLVDGKVFQFDDQFKQYRENKLKACNESLDKYICVQPGSNLSVACDFIIDTLCKDYPEYFSLHNKSAQLDCHLTGVQLKTGTIDRFAALGMQLQEDLAIMKVNENGEGRLIALHLCAPNHWAARDKIGKDFTQIHAPVPDMHRINLRNKEINHACLHKGPFVRFAWGLSTDKYLNHHPQPPVGTSGKQWHGREFSHEKPELYMRVERQTLHGFKNQGLILFTIRTYFYDVVTLNKQRQYSLLNAIKSMNENVLIYKGLKKNSDDIINWLTDIL